MLLYSKIQGEENRGVIGGKTEVAETWHRNGYTVTQE